MDISASFGINKNISSNIKINYVETVPSSRIEGFDHHIHSECEIYINITGDVSFMVENNIYAIRRGSIIITRPGEYHHCIYHSDATHKHFWILLTADEKDEFFAAFYKRTIGSGNLITLSDEDTEEMLGLAFDMIYSTDNALKRTSDFLRMLCLLECSRGISESDLDTTFSDVVLGALKYIDNNISHSFTVDDIAKSLHININTLERKFKSELGLSPSKHIKKKRLARATRLLSDGLPVSEVAMQCGFCDCSGFIKDFKKEFGKTPKKYTERFN